MKDLHIYYFSTALTDEIYDEVVRKSKRFKPTFSGVGFDRNIAIGLSRQIKITGVSLFPIPSYPKYSKIAQGHKRFTIGNFSCYVPGMISLPIIKEIIFGVKAYRAVQHDLNPDEENVILISGLYRSLLRPANWLKKKFGLPIVAIVPDIPELMITYRKDYNWVRRILNNLDIKRAIKFRKVADGFVLLSKYMNPVVNVDNKPWTLVDGLCDTSSIDSVKASENPHGRYILYAGKISATFGVDKLVEGFIKANIEDVSLVLCGDGDYSQTLKQIASNSEKIIYKGTVSHEEVLRLEKSATLLVDPRPINGKISKMSFPSKIIEYMASGTPVLVSNIPSFSEEYLPHQYRIKEVSAEGIEQSLKEVFALGAEELKTKGNQARSFILNNKTISCQCKKIVGLITSIIKQ